jgi:hypothetical protein
VQVKSKTDLTFDEVKKAGIEAFWYGHTSECVLEYDPTDESVWMKARTGYYPPAPTPRTGWYHDETCACEFCGGL